MADTPFPSHTNPLLAFTAAMDAELRANEPNKGDRADWLARDYDAVADVKRHVEKLEKALAANDPARTLEHAADVANCALIVADRAKLLGEHPPKRPAPPPVYFPSGGMYGNTRRGGDGMDY